MPSTISDNAKEQVEIRPASEGDLERMVQLYNEGYPSLMNVDFLSVNRFREKGRYDFVVLSTDGEVVATGAVYGVCFRDLKGMVGYVVTPSMRRRGVAHSLLEFLLDFGFGRLGLTKLTAHCIEGLGGKAVAEKSGMGIEAILKNELIKEGKYADVVILSIFSEDRGKPCRQ